MQREPAPRPEVTGRPLMAAVRFVSELPPVAQEPEGHQTWGLWEGGGRGVLALARPRGPRVCRGQGRCLHSSQTQSLGRGSQLCSLSNKGRHRENGRVREEGAEVSDSENQQQGERTLIYGRNANAPSSLLCWFRFSFPGWPLPEGSDTFF